MMEEKCYLCGWTGKIEAVEKLYPVKGPMFGQPTTGYKCPKCESIYKYAGEACQETQKENDYGGAR
jgi:hypothetical protein